MKNQTKKYKLQLEIYFNKPSEITEKAFLVRDAISEGKFVDNQVTTKYEVLYSQEPKFRFERHNGQDFIIYESKINNEI